MYVKTQCGSWITHVHCTCSVYAYSSDQLPYISMTCAGVHVHVHVHVQNMFMLCSQIYTCRQSSHVCTHTHTYTHTHTHTHNLTRTLNNTVCDDHLFKDERLFFRFRKDDGTYEEPPDSAILAKGQRMYSKWATTSVTCLLGQLKLNIRVGLLCCVFSSVLRLTNFS